MLCDLRIVFATKASAPVIGDKGDAMIIVQMTDLHVVARDRLCYRKIPTNAQLAEAVAHINTLDPRPDAVIA